MRFDYLEPKTTEEAIALLTRYGTEAKVIAGGTDLIRGMRQKLTRLRDVKYLVDITNIPGWDYVKNDESGLTIGALTTLRNLETSAELRQRCPVISQAAGRAGSVAMRNVATLGGNLCQESKCLHYAGIYRWAPEPCHHGGGSVCYAVPGAKSCQAMATNELAPALLCLDSLVCISGPAGERTKRLEDFFIEPGALALSNTEILTGIKIPVLPTSMRQVYLKYSYTGTLNIPVVGVAAVITISEGVCSDAKIALLGAATTPLRAQKAEKILRGERVSGSTIDRCSKVAAEEARPLSDGRASAQYRRAMIKTFTKRALTQAAAL
jgi:carbon-monoxide dehydrogenase medium subunit